MPNRYGQAGEEMNAMRKLPHFGRSLIVSQCAMLSAVALLRAQVAQTPPMGWDSYDSYGGFVNEAQVEANAQYMATNLKQFGYNTIIIDFCWSYPGTGSGGTSNGQLMQSYATTNGIVSSQPTPALTMNADGELLPDPTRFPSAVPGGVNEGFTALAAYIHGLGLNFGIHIMRGIPVQAYYNNTPVAGDPGVTAQQITDAGTGDQAPWLNQMYGLDTGSNGQLTTGAQAYYNSLFDMYASWGVDYVKVDDMLSTTYHSADVAGIQQAITQSGRPMVLSLSPGPAPLSQADQLGQDANMWRMLNDMWDNWSDVSSAFSAAASWNQIMGPGHWPDADMLPIGTFVNPPVGTARSSGLTHNQQQTVMTLWSIIKSPLIMGGNLPSLSTDPFTTSLLTNSSILAIDQNSLNNHQVSSANNKVVWEADVPNSASKYLALFNIGTTTTSVSTTFASLGLSATTSYDVENLWTSTDLGHFTGTFSQSLASDSSGMYEIMNTVATAAPAWSQNSSGDWNTLSNWSTGFVPDAAGAEADFFGSITSGHTVFTDIPVTAGTINFNNSKTYVVGGAGTLTMRVTAGSAQIIVQAGSQQITLPMTIASNTLFNVSTGATLVISGPLTINSGQTITQTGGGTVLYETPLNLGAGASLVVGGSATNGGALSANTVTNSGIFTQTGTLTETGNFTNSGTATIGGSQTWSTGTTFANTAGTAIFTSDAGSISASPLSINATGGSVSFGSTQHLAALNIASGASAIVSVSSTRNVIAVGSLSVAGSLDLTNNDLIVHNGNLGTVTTAGSITNEIAQGHGRNGLWTGIGITSSAAATSPGNTALGVELNNNGSSGTLMSTFDGQTVTSTDVLVKYTFVGDADLSGTVNATDYTLIDSGFNSDGALTGWRNGDFNYDGVINGDDYALIDNAFNTQGTTTYAVLPADPTEMIATDTAQIAAPSSTVIPEPGSLSFVSLLVFGLIARKRR
jgi:alpha-galactosidase